MEYFYAFQRWLYATTFYQEILKELPVPLNNIYFDSLVLIALAVYLVYRIIEAIHIACHRRRIRRKQERERKKQMEREKEMMYRELQVQQKEEKVGRFMDYMEMLFASRTGRADDYETYSSPETYNRPEYQNRRVGRKNFFLQRKVRFQIAQKDEVPDTSDYDSVMDAFVYDVEQEQKISKRQEAEREQLHSKINELDDELRVRAVDNFSETAVAKAEDPELEKRKARARKEEEKERKRREKLLRKKQKGDRHGRFGKKSQRGG